MAPHNTINPLSTDAIYNLSGRVALVTGGGSGMSVSIIYSLIPHEIMAHVLSFFHAS